LLFYINTSSALQYRHLPQLVVSISETPLNFEKGLLDELVALWTKVKA